MLSKQLAVGQIPTEWNYSDIGTKPLKKSRLMILLNQIGAMDPINLEMVGQEEFDAVASRLVGQQSLKRVAKALFRMAALWGLESLAQNGAEAAEITFEDGGTCSLKQLRNMVAMVCIGPDVLALDSFCSCGIHGREKVEP